MSYKVSTHDHQADDSDYTLHFGPILNGGGIVRFIDHARKSTSDVGISISDQDFQYRIYQHFPSVIADLVDLAVAIHASDRLAFQHLHKRQSRLHVVLPVRHPELLGIPSFMNKLEKLLSWVTGSKWSFNFQALVASGRMVENQGVLPVALPTGCEVALWSGGLDALAGLYTRLKTEPDQPFLLFGAGSNDNAYARQAEVFNSLIPSFPSRLNLCRVPIRFTESGRHRKNKISRARGIVFTMLGAASAYLMGQRVLYLYENGVGAINLPYRASAVGLDHSRSVHPLTLLMVSELVTELIGEEFKIHNPFLLWTKAEMCQSLKEDSRTDLPPLTMSCDSPHRQKPVQCGYCPSCLLRRQALATSGLLDKTQYVILNGKAPASDPSVYLRHMLEQVSTLRQLLHASTNTKVKWEAIAREFPVLDDIVDRGASTEELTYIQMRTRLIKLYQNYIAEWDNIGSQLSIGLFNHSSEQAAAMPLAAT
ncbi:7-cyano-7-deazaguanine synthase [Phormidium tenue]|uniref:ATPase n=1 Tax=Phormidium tenue NIES-30 TaxID=549789 RepID=A0A1U7J666_9CYAN|nr:7-cyano-7-deazaguanine synthase [Phormidium tenue]MBD2232100.1 7-cyano-7-deazaguanine synthase [Phormidium tenue FACHB-1052]OKH48313.1 hypothetical protein NIES30_09760 [Phormidium tenue NIES-30]